MIAKTAIIYPNVHIGKNAIIEDYCIIGVQFKDYSGEKTIIGDNAVIRSHTVIYAGTIIGNNFQSGNKANIREYNRIGDNVSVGSLSVVEHHVHIGNAVRVHSQAFIPEYTVLEDDCWIGPQVVITNAKYPKHPNAKNELKGAHIGKNAKVGANSTLLPDISIGKDALIGAGSVVVKDVRPRVIVVGNPAKELRKVHY